MENDAEVPADLVLDHEVLDHERFSHALFGTPIMPLETTDYAIGMAASALIPDGGTLQIGIGSLGDAIAYGCVLRHEDPDSYARALREFQLQPRFPDIIEDTGGVQSLEIGLYGSSEMVTDGFRQLFDREILKREVFPDATVQRIANEHGGRGHVEPWMLDVLVEAGAIGPQLDRADVAYLKRFGGARSILMVRSTRAKGGAVSCNIVWSYGQVTIPRHLRDIVVTEYGIADLRGKRDHEIIAELLNVTDSRFQDGLLETAKRAGKIASDYAIPEVHRNNRPECLAQALARLRDDGLFPKFPFGTDFTVVELVLGKVLRGLKVRMSDRRQMAGALVNALKVPTAAMEKANPYLARLDLLAPGNVRERMLQRVIVSELQTGGYL